MKIIKLVIIITLLHLHGSAAWAIDFGPRWNLTPQDSAFFDLRCDYKIAIYENRTDPNPRLVIVATSIEPQSLGAPLAHDHTYDIHHQRKTEAKLSYYTGQDSDGAIHHARVYQRCPRNGSD